MDRITHVELDVEIRAQLELCICFNAEINRRKKITLCEHLLGDYLIHIYLFYLVVFISGKYVYSYYNFS